MDINVVNVSRLAVSGIALQMRDPSVAQNPEKEEDSRPFLLSDIDGSIVEIDIYGPDHMRVKPLMDAQKARFTQQALMINSRKGVKVDASDVALEEEENFAIAMAATHGWRGWTNGREDNEAKTPIPFPFSSDNAQTLFEYQKDFVDQIVAALRGRSNFLGKSKKR